MLCTTEGDLSTLNPSQNHFRAHNSPIIACRKIIIIDLSIYPISQTSSTQKTKQSKASFKMYLSYSTHLTPSLIQPKANSKLSKNSLSTTNTNLLSRFLLCIRDLAIIDNQRISSCTFTECPVDFLGECCSGIGEEELFTN